MVADAILDLTLRPGFGQPGLRACLTIDADEAAVQIEYEILIDPDPVTQTGYRLESGRATGCLPRALACEVVGATRGAILGAEAEKPMIFDGVSLEAALEMPGSDPLWAHLRCTDRNSAVSAAKAFLAAAAELTPPHRGLEPVLAGIAEQLG